jgi:hypothetical protein
LAGEVDKNDISNICGTYMTVRESILMNDGQLTRWVEKG